VLNRLESTELSQATILVHTQEDPITLPMVGSGQVLRLNARCLRIEPFATRNTRIKEKVFTQQSYRTEQNIYFV